MPDSYDGLESFLGTEKDRAKLVTRVDKDGNLHTAFEYEDAAFEQAWCDVSGQGQHEARSKGRWCVVVPCERDLALFLAQLFVHHIFAMPSCTHYDGATLSLYCGDAGSGADTTMFLAEVMVNVVLACRKKWMREGL